jgi:hypothetical protein
MKVYCVRAGKGNSNIDYFLESRCINIDYGINFDLLDTSIDIVDFLSKNSNKNQVAQYISQINLFKNIKEGDIILSPSNDDINVGKVSSSIFLKNNKNTIDVSWMKKINKCKDINQPKTVFEIFDFDFDRLDFIDKSTKNTLSVLIDGKTITDKNSTNTFVELINYLSNKIGKENLAEDFPKIFSKSEFINPKTNKRYAHRVDDSGDYLIYTNTDNDYKKSILESLYKKYNIDIEVSIVEELLDVVYEFVLTDDSIINNINDLCSKTLEIQKYINNVDYLCDKLNSLDKSFIRNYYNSKNNGVVIDIRKEVAKEILLTDITKDKLESIIESHKSKNKQKLNSWVNPYKILHPFITNTYKDLDIFINNFIKLLINRIGDVKFNISNFNGSQNQGSEKYYFSIFNKSHRNQSEGLQIFLDFKEGNLYYGIYRHIDESYVYEPKVFNGDVNEIYSFIDQYKETILNDNKNAKDSIILDIKNIFQNNGNSLMTCKEVSFILKKIKENNISDLLNSDLFDKITTDETRYRLSNYLPTKLVDSIKSYDFVTIEMLVEILNKNNININI